MKKFLNILSDLLIESKRIKLDNETILKIEDFTEKIYRYKLTKINKYKIIGSMPITTSDGVLGQVEIVIDPKLPYLGLLHQKVEDSTDPNDFIISINPNKISSKKYLYQTIYHEIMHATDPVFSTKQSKKAWSTFDTEVDEKYWAHPIEFRASSNEFLEGIVREFNLRKSRLKNKTNVSSLEKAADNILDYFAKNEKLSKLSYNIISSITDDEHIKNVSEKILRNIPLDFPDVTELMPEKKNPPYYLPVIEMIKKYDPEIWKKFLSMLYNTIIEIKSSLKNI